MVFEIFFKKYNELFELVLEGAIILRRCPSFIYLVPHSIVFKCCGHKYLSKLKKIT